MLYILAGAVYIGALFFAWAMCRSAALGEAQARRAFDGRDRS